MQKELFPVEESYRTDFEGETRECRTCSIVKGLDMFAPASYGYNKEGKSNLRRGAICYACFAKSKMLRKKHTLDYPNPKNTDYICPICCKNQEELTTHGRYKSDDGDDRGHPWHLDHCHTTGNYRGWLCGTCNQALGKFNDSTECLQSAIEYLERSINDN